MGHDGPAFKRILLKLSGESLMGSLDYGTDPERLKAVAGQIKKVHDRGVEIGIVLGQEGRSGKMEMHCVPIDVLDGSLRDHVSPDPYTVFAHGFDLAEAQAVNAIDRHPRLDPNWLK